MPKVSILMANYNGEKYIREAIDSVLKQSFFDWELLICDDCSTDNSKEIINEYKDNDKIVLVYNKERKGKIACLKKMINTSKGEIMAVFDSDDVIAPETILKIVEVYEYNKDIGYVYTQCEYCDENLNPMHIGFSAKILEGKSNLHQNSVVAMRTFKKSVYLETSGYDEKCLYAEDIDFVLKAEEKTKLYFLDEALYKYRILKKSQSHGRINTQINRSSTALAKLNAYKRRLNTDIPNLNRSEMAEVLFFGIITSIMALRFKLTFKFVKEVLKIHPLFLFDINFYKNIIFKIKKLINLKKTKPLLKI